jgi:hypothetical protein
MVEAKLKLTSLEARVLRGWVIDRMDEMEPDRESIEEEDPGLMNALTQLHAVLDLAINTG